MRCGLVQMCGVALSVALGVSGPSNAQQAVQITPEQAAAICTGVKSIVEKGGRGAVARDGVQVQVAEDKEVRIYTSGESVANMTITYSEYTKCLTDILYPQKSKQESEWAEIQRLQKESDDAIRRRISKILFVNSSNPKCAQIIGNVQTLVSPVNIRPPFATPVDINSITPERLNVMLMDARQRISDREISTNIAIDSLVADGRAAGCIFH